MINLWYARIVNLKVSTLPDVPERYYDGVKTKLDDAGLDSAGNPIVIDEE